MPHASLTVFSASAFLGKWKTRRILRHVAAILNAANASAGLPVAVKLSISSAYAFSGEEWAFKPQQEARIKTKPNPPIDATKPLLDQMLRLMLELPRTDITHMPIFTPGQRSKAQAVANYANEICRIIGAGMRQFTLIMVECERIALTDQLVKEMDIDAHTRMIEYLNSQLKLMQGGN